MATRLRLLPNGRLSVNPSSRSPWYKPHFSCDRLGVRSNASHQAIRNKTAGMSGCIYTLKKEATKPAATNVMQPQAQFDDFITRYNTDRPHRRSG